MEIGTSRTNHQITLVCSFICKNIVVFKCPEFALLELDQFFLVLLQNLQNTLGLIGIGHEYFKYMKSFKLDVSRLVSQQIHH
jgi:hypothetical protein